MRAALLFAALLGIPLLLLYGLVTMGERLAAPRSVGGEWAIDPAFLDRATWPCPGLELGPDTVLHVSQSGTRAEVTVGAHLPVAIAATVLGDSLVGEASHGPDARCPGGVLRLRAELRDEIPGSRSLHGVLFTDSASTPFVATRLPAVEES